MAQPPKQLAHSRLRRLTKKLHQTHPKKHKPNHHHPPSKPDNDTFLYRLKQLNRHTTETRLNNLNREVLQKVKQKGTITKKSPYQ